ncbi:MAG: hypothetical protein AAF755_07895 [Pseudomonadota bacterium]
MDYVFTNCASDNLAAQEQELSRIGDGNEDLLREIAFLERELATIQCVAQYVPPVEPELPDEVEPSVDPVPLEEPPDPPELPSQPDGLDRGAFDNRDVAVLEGCWYLDSDYRTRNLETGRVLRAVSWQACFDETGKGTHQIQMEDGTSCTGPLTGGFNDGGRLIMQDGEEMQCSDGSFIYKREITCSLDATGRAQCVSVQPTSPQPGQASVGLRRATGTP